MTTDEMGQLSVGESVDVRFDGAWRAATVHAIYAAGIDACIAERGCWYVRSEDVRQAQNRAVATLRRHVTGAIVRGEAEPITEQTARALEVEEAHEPSARRRVELRHRAQAARSVTFNVADALRGYAQTLRVRAQRADDEDIARAEDDGMVGA
jgi:hypothetical protein